MSDKKSTLQKVISLNISLVIAEIIAGIYSGSMALIADAFHNLGDVLALFISLIAIVYGAKKASESMTFGYIKAEIMAELKPEKPEEMPVEESKPTEPMPDPEKEELKKSLELKTAEAEKLKAELEKEVKKSVQVKEVVSPEKEVKKQFSMFN